LGFFIRKTLIAVLMPLPAALIVASVGCFILWRGKRKRLGRLLVATALVGLTLLSIEPVSKALARPLEGAAPAFPGDSVEFVVVLGHGHDSDPSLPVSARLSAQALYRLTEGVRIANAQPWTRLVLSGYGGSDPVPNAVVYADMAAALGVGRDRMVIEARPSSTSEEARDLEPLLRGRSFALVTSAAHMPRALGIFRAQGLTPTPAPTGHLAKRRQGFDVLRLLPREENLLRSQVAWYEILGRVWARLRGEG